MNCNYGLSMLEPKQLRMYMHFDTNVELVALVLGTVAREQYQRKRCWRSQRLARGQRHSVPRLVRGQRLSVPRCADHHLPRQAYPRDVGVKMVSSMPCPSEDDSSSVASDLVYPCENVRENVVLDT